MTWSKTISAACSEAARRLGAHVPAIGTVSDPGEADDAAGGDEPGGDAHRDPEPVQVEVRAAAGGRGADDRDPEQPGDPRDRVVDPRGDPGVALAGVGEHGRGERRNVIESPTENRSSGGRSVVQ